MSIPSYPDLAGKVAVVTGGSRGIGAETCRQLAANGVRVAVCGRDKAAIEEVVTQITAAGGQALGAVADCTDADALARLRAEAEAGLGPVDILAAFAGGGGDPVPLERITDEDWHQVLDDNLTSTFLTLRAFVPGMVSRRAGSVITMASTAGRQAGGASLSYAAAKAGVLMLTRHLARELGEHNVRINCLAPSAVLNERLAARLPEERRAQVAAQFPLRRLGLPQDVAQAAMFLASDAASWLTGITLDVAGGRVML